jgi:glutamine synthetase
MSYAPVAPTWGINNRSVSLRVPAGAAASRHIEHRVCGADANPYLAAAAVLAGVRLGIEQQLDPGEPVTGNGYAQRSTAVLPRDWHTAICAAESSSFLRNAFGSRFLDAFIAIKRQEWDKFNAQVTQLDYDWYENV